MSYEYDNSGIAGHLDGISWHEAPRPTRDHECWPQTIPDPLNPHSDWMRGRCPCGAVMFRDGGTTDKNTRLLPHEPTEKVPEAKPGLFRRLFRCMP